MPINKQDNKKNAPIEKRDSAIVPTKDEAHTRDIPQGSQKDLPLRTVDALSTQGKDKKPK